MTELKFTDDDLRRFRADYDEFPVEKIEALLKRLEAAEKENEKLRRLLARERDAFGKKETELLTTITLVERWAESFNNALREGRP